jgi:hypothetical protein
MSSRPPGEENPIRNQLTQLYDVLSHKIAGGQRSDHRDLLPGADDPLEGLIPEEFRDQLTELDWYTPTDWAGLGAEDALRADLTQIPEPGGKVVDGKGSDFFRTGEAPDNFTNRHNPLYKARSEFASQVAPKLNELFGVTGNAGHYRQPKASDKAPGGPSANSDHYSAGAVDFFGTTEQLDALRDYLVDQPWVSFVRWRSESHGGESGTEEGAHVHASFDLGWIARNYFAGRTSPSLPKTAPSRPSTAPVDASEPVQVSDDPSANRAI